MFESSKKKEPKLVFVHKSSPPPVVSTRPAEPPNQMPRFTVVANGQVKQTKADESTLQKTVNSVAINSSDATGLKPQKVIPVNSGGLANQKYEQKLANNSVGLANQKPQDIVDDKGKEPTNPKIQQAIVAPGNALANQKPQQIFQQALQHKTEQQSLQKQSLQQHHKEQLSSQTIQSQKGPQTQSADVTKEQPSKNARLTSGQPQVAQLIQNETQTQAGKHGSDQQAPNGDRNVTRPPETSHQGFSKISLVSQDREMQQATITFTEEKTLDTNITAAPTEKPNGHSNVYPPQSFKRDSDASKFSQPTQDLQNSPANQLTEKFEGFSIYRGRQEIPNSKQSISKEKSETVISTMQNSPSTVNNSGKSVSVATVVTSGATLTPNNDEDSVTLRHPKSAPAVSPAQKQPAPAQQLQKQHQQYQKTHQLLQGHPQAVVIDPYRQGDYGYQTMPHTRVYSYPQAVRQPSAKAIRLVGPYIQEQVYQHPGQRQAPSVKTRSFSASSASHVRYPGGTGQWQASPTQTYYVYAEDSNPNPRGNAGSTETSHGQDAVSYKPPQVSNGQRPKSILKSPSLPEAPPEWHNNARPMKLPRPQSMLNPTPNKRDFDFSSILSANSDIVSYTKHTHHQGRSPSLSQTQPSRPVSAGSIPQRPEAPLEGTPQRKSVTFNSQVRLHTEDRVSIVTPLVVDS